MSQFKKYPLFTLIAITAVCSVGTLSMMGCAGSKNLALSDLETRLLEQDDQITELKSSLADRDAKMATLSEQITSTEDARQQAYTEMERMRAQDTNTDVGLLPPASPGECYTRVFVPAEYSQVSEQVLVKDASSRYETKSARYEWVEEQVLVQEASTRLEEIPARYEWTEEQILVKAAHTVWKKGRGPVERIDQSTGEIMCLVEVPAEYRTVRKQVLVEKASTRVVQIPAVYETVKVQKLVAPAHEELIEIPAEYSSVTRWVKTSDGYMEWRQVMCETNLSYNHVRQIQKALHDAGHHPGPIDGVIGYQTLAAVESYQQQKGLAVGGLTHETVSSLGVKLL